MSILSYGAKTTQAELVFFYHNTIVSIADMACKDDQKVMDRWAIRLLAGYLQIACRHSALEKQGMA